MFRYLLLLVTLLSIVPTTTFANCDYSAAAQNGGWGWNASTGQGCPPQSSSESSGGGGEIVALRVSWPANPSSEGVDRYEVRYSRNDGGWNTNQNLIAWNGSTQKDMYLSDYNLQGGDKICVQVRAGTWEKWSAYSDTTCVDIPASGTSTGGSNDGSVSQPNKPTITLIGQ